MFTTSFNEAKKASDTRNADKPRPMWSQAQRRERMLVVLYPWVRRRMVNTPSRRDEVDEVLWGSLPQTDDLPPNSTHAKEADYVDDGANKA